MYKALLFCASVGLILLCNSCNKTEESLTLQTESFNLADSTTYANLRLEIELPVVSDKITMSIREKLLEKLGNRLTHATSYENEQLYLPFQGDTHNTKTMLDYYLKNTRDLLGKQSEEDANDRIKFLRENKDLTEEEINERISDIPHWEYNFTLKKIADTLNYVIFLSQDYIYMGGAHGGVSGDGSLTFNKNDGSLIEAFLDSSRVDSIQPLIVNGLLSYYHSMDERITEEDMRSRLMIDGNLIPLPALRPYPTAVGLVFTYQQYEIACYADGMPNFVIPYNNIAAFLTPEARKICQAYLNTEK